MNTTINLLVIDDDEVDRLQLKKALKSCGLTCELVECGSADSILDVVHGTPFDCIFLDYLLPGENGLQLVKKLREAGIKTPIVITTSHGNESIAVDLMKSGASDYIIKDEINGEALGHILRNTLRMRAVEREREEAEQALRIGKERLAEAQRIAKIGNWEYDIINDTLYWSQEMFKIYELSPSTFNPTIRNYMDLILGEDRQLVKAKTKEAFQGLPFNIDIRLTTATGIKYVNSQGYALIDKGQPLKILGTLQDITERKLAEQEIQKAREIAESSMKVKEVFLANMSHEIRTPMNAILGFTHLLAEITLSKEQQSFVDAIHFSGKNLLVIINDILDLSKIKSGKMQLEKCKFNLSELVDGVISVLKPKAIEKGVQLSSKIDEHVPTYVIGDPVRLNQILTNLIGNSLKFTEKGGVYLNINLVNVSKQACTIEFNVIDTGIGIPLEMQSAVFENFVQASSETTRKYGGTGLGLTIVKDLVELQNGKITLTSSPGHGTTFTVDIPFEKGEQGKVPGQKEVESIVESYEELKGVKVLIAEDNNLNQLLIRKVLERKGCNIDIANNGLEVLDLIKTKKYDIILMDIQMPEMDGQETTKHIRAQVSSVHANVPIIALTAHAFGSDVSKSIAAGMNDYVSKPFQPEILYSTMLKYLERDNGKVISLSQARNSIDLAPIYELASGDAGFLGELIAMYDYQTPVFSERLRASLESHNFGAIKSICHQIKSSYGILKMSELEKALTNISILLDAKKSKKEIECITEQVEFIISLISRITEEVKQSLKKAG